MCVADQFTVASHGAPRLKLVPKLLSEYRVIGIAVAKRIRLRANVRLLWLVVGYHSGARKGELRKVRWEQVDFEGALIRLTVTQTKGKKARTLPIYGDMERWLKLQRETCPNGCPWVFHGRLNRPVDSHMNGWPEACQRAGLDGLLFHDLRRSAVRNMTRAGIPDTIAMAISGHKTRAVFDRYNIISEADVQDAAGKLEQYVERRKIERAAPLKRAK